MYEHRMKLFDGHFISTLSTAFCLYKNGRQGGASRDGDFWCSRDLWRFENKVAIITGGVTGIGKETALLFAGEGAKIVITDINQESGDQAVKDIQAIGGEAVFIRHDVSNEEDWKKVAKETIETFDKVDVLFNNAGIYIIKPVTEIELEEWNRLMSINVTGVFLGMKHIMPLMAKQNKCSVINASSIAGLIGAPLVMYYTVLFIASDESSYTTGTEFVIDGGATAR